MPKLAESVAGAVARGVMSGLHWAAGVPMARKAQRSVALSKLNNGTTLRGTCSNLAQGHARSRHSAKRLAKSGSGGQSERVLAKD